MRTVYDRPVQPYTPSLYMLSAPILGRTRSYPRTTVTPIPGAGYKANLVWGEQVLNLDGSAAMRRPYPYGRYTAGVPLLGLGGYLGQVPAPSASGTCPPGYTYQPATTGDPGLPARCAPQASLSQPFPAASDNVFTRFAGIAKRIWMMPSPQVAYGPSTTTLTFSGTGDAARPTNYDALVEYAKITAVGTFAGIPIAFLLGHFMAPRMVRNRVRRNSRRRRAR